GGDGERSRLIAPLDRGRVRIAGPFSPICEPADAEANAGGDPHRANRTQFLEKEIEVDAVRLEFPPGLKLVDVQRAEVRKGDCATEALAVAIADLDPRGDRRARRRIRSMVVQVHPSVEETKLVVQ